MDKQHALNVLNSKQHNNVVKLFEKYAQVPEATDICVKDLDFSGLQIAYSKERQEKTFNLAFPNPIENFEGIREVLIALLGEEAAAQEQTNFQQNPQWGFNPMGFGPQAQGFNPHNPQGFGPQGQHPFGSAPFGAQGANPQQGFNPHFQGFGPHGMPLHSMFMFGILPFWGFGHMGFHAPHAQAGFNPMGFGPQAQGFNPQSQYPQGGFHPQNGFNPQPPHNSAEPQKP
ncbi:DUF2470 domain-containing protein [Helicobacter heilmannii]|uniref:DUF2470 domain-containing protein n=1 Tax=Helicobacter heilmannii TaxID=35817 RepID=UPI000CF014F5|nr:DUF2470 domain-containing protein [Helicobacter heilmannii]